jgi:hypothetical protein
LFASRRAEGDVGNGTGAISGAVGNRTNVIVGDFSTEQALFFAMI